MSRRTVLSFLILFTFRLHAQVGTKMDIRDGFEERLLSDLWESIRLVPTSVELQSAVVRRGHGAVKITVRPGDMFEAGENGDADSERDELLENRKYVSAEDAVYEYSWSMFLPSDFPIVSNRLVVAQWKEFCRETVKACSDDSPVLAVRYSNGLLQITQDIDRHFNVLYESKQDLRGKWIDLRFRTKFTPKGSGRIDAWIGEQKVVTFKGATANQESKQSGYTSPGHFFFKMGLYRNVMAIPMTIYFDEYRKREISPKP